MALNLTSPVTGAAQTGFTAPTYTLVPDIAPGINAKQWAVSGLGGTQAGVRVHTVSDPFTIAVFRPLTLKSLPTGQLTNSILKAVPRNEYTQITRVGLIPAAGQVPIPVAFKQSFPIPAGADAYDIARARGALSLHIGALTQLSASWGDTFASGTI